MSRSEYLSSIILLQGCRLRFLGQVSKIEPLVSEVAAKEGDSEIWRLRAEAIILFVDNPTSIKKAEISLQKSARYRMSFNDLQAAQVTENLPQNFTYLSVWSMILYRKLNYSNSLQAALRGVDMASKETWGIELIDFHSLTLLAEVSYRAVLYQYCFSL